MSRSWIILQESPWGQCLLLRWQEAQMQSAGLALLMDGIILSGLPLKIRVPERSSTVGVATEGQERFVSFVGCPFWFLTGNVRFYWSSLDLACLRSSACKSGHDGMVSVPLLNLQRMLMQSSSRSNASMNFSVAMLPMFPWAMRDAFLVCGSGCMRGVLS